MTKIEPSIIIHCMINASNYMTAFDDAGVSPYGDTPLKVMLGDNGPFVVDRVEVDVTDRENPLGVVLYVTDPAATEHLSTSDESLAPSPFASPAPENQGFDPIETADQVPASGGSGQVSSDTGQAPRVKY